MYYLGLFHLFMHWNHRYPADPPTRPHKWVPTSWLASVCSSQWDITYITQLPTYHVPISGSTWSLAWPWWSSTSSTSVCWPVNGCSTSTTISCSGYCLWYAPLIPGYLISHWPYPLHVSCRVSVPTMLIHCSSRHWDQLRRSLESMKTADYPMDHIGYCWWICSWPLHNFYMSSYMEILACTLL